MIRRCPSCGKMTWPGRRTMLTIVATPEILVRLGAAFAVGVKDHLGSTPVLDMGPAWVLQSIIINDFLHDRRECLNIASRDAVTWVVDGSNRAYLAHTLKSGKVIKGNIYGTHWVGDAA